MSAGGRARRRSCRRLPEQESYHQVHQEAYCQVHQSAHQAAHVSSSCKLHQSRVRFFARAASPVELTQAGAARLAIAVRSRRRTPPRFGLELSVLMHSRATPKKCAVKSAKCYSKYNVAMTFYTAPCSASQPFMGCQCVGRCARASLVNCPQNDGTNALLPDVQSAREWLQRRRV